MQNEITSLQKVSAWLRTGRCAGSTVWFQCEDCGEKYLEKPKLSNHFLGCSARKEKYGPLKFGLSNRPPCDRDLELGLSTRPPWACSICNVKATSEKTLFQHSEGRKHRNKVRESVAKVTVTFFNFLAAKTKSAAIPADDKKPTEQAAVVDAPVAVKKRKSNQHENGDATPTSASQVTDPENASIADGAGEVGGLKQQKKKSKVRNLQWHQSKGQRNMRLLLRRKMGRIRKRVRSQKMIHFQQWLVGNGILRMTN